MHSKFWSEQLACFTVDTMDMLIFKEKDIVVILVRPDDGGVPRDGNRIAEKVSRRPIQGPEFLLL